VTPLLERLQQRLDTCQDPAQRAELLAERACYLARTGDIAGAQETIAWLRTHFGDGRHPRVSVWIMLAEGITKYFSDSASAAAERLSRAGLLAEAMGFSDICRLASAWSAHVDFNRAQFGAMVKHLMSCGPVNLVDPTAADGRLTLTLADAFTYAGRMDEARRWYAKAHRVAISLGDQAGVAALMYNRSAMRIARMRVSAALNLELGDEFKHLSMEVASASGFHDAIGHRSLPHLLDYIESQSFMAAKQYEASLLKLDDLLANSETYAHSFEPITYQLDRSLCLIGLGRHSEALSIIEGEVLSSLDRVSELDVDDALVFWARLVNVCEALGLGQVAAVSRDGLEKARTDFEAIQRELHGALSLWESHSVSAG
jgi:tetratricopeptide (TPR) repeat protein